MPASSREQVSASYTACWEHFNAHDWAALAACYAEDAIGHEAGNPTTFAGRANIVDRHRELFARAFSDGKVMPQLVLVRPKEIVSVVFFAGTHDGPLALPKQNIPATKKRVGLFGLHRAVLDDSDRVKEDWLVFDTPSLLTQLGKAEGGRKRISEGIAAQPTFAATMDSDEEKYNFALSQALYDEFSSHELDVDDYFKDEVVDANPSLPADVTGKPALKELFAGYFAAFSEVFVETEREWVAGKYTVAVGHVYGTNDGVAPGLGIEHKTGKNIDQFFVEVLEWSGARVIKRMPFYNSVEMASQIGVALPPP